MVKKLLILFVTTVLLAACGENKKEQAESSLTEIIIKDFDNDEKFDTLKVYCDIGEYETVFLLALSEDDYKEQKLVMHGVSYDIATKGNSIVVDYQHDYSVHNEASLYFFYDDEEQKMLLYSFTYCAYDHYNDEPYKKYTGEFSDYDETWNFTCSLSGLFIDDFGHIETQIFFEDDTLINTEIFNEVFLQTIERTQITESYEWKDGFDFVFKKVEDLESALVEIQQEKYKEHYVHHEVMQGETLYGLSKLYGVRVEDITTENSIKDEKLTAGLTIKIPVYKKK